MEIEIGQGKRLGQLVVGPDSALSVNGPSNLIIAEGTKTHDFLGKDKRKLNLGREELYSIIKCYFEETNLPVPGNFHHQVDFAVDLETPRDGTENSDVIDGIRRVLFAFDEHNYKVIEK